MSTFFIRKEPPCGVLQEFMESICSHSYGFLGIFDVITVRTVIWPGLLETVIVRPSQDDTSTSQTDSVRSQRIDPVSGSFNLV